MASKPVNSQKIKEKSPAIFQNTPKTDKKQGKEDEILEMEKVLKEFNAQKTEFALDLYLKFLNNILKSKKTQFLSSRKDVNLKQNIYQELKKVPEVEECIAELKKHILEMNNHETTNFLSLLSKLDYYDEELISFLCSRIAKKEITLNSLAISYFVWSLARFRVKNDKLVDVLANSLLENPKLNPKSQANIFWAISTLNYKNESLIKMLEENILKNALNFDSTEINLIFGAYCNNRMPNHDVLDALSMKVLSIADDFTFRNIANWLNYCATLNYSNMNCFALIEQLLIKKIKAFEIKESQESLQMIEDLEKTLVKKLKKEAKSKKISIEEAAENTAVEPEILENFIFQEKDFDSAEKAEEDDPKKNDVLTPFDASQILLSFCKMKVVKPELFELLEASFVKMMPIANPSSFTAFAFAHSSLCTEMQMKFYENKKYLLRRSIKNLKKYNQLFYELMLPHIKNKLTEFKFEEIYSILLSASRPLVKKRAVCRGLIEMAITGLPLLKQNFKKLPQEGLEKMVFQYFRVAMNFVFKEEQRVALERSIQEIDFDIKKICVQYGYLIPQTPEIELKNNEEEEGKEEKQN